MYMWEYIRTLRMKLWASAHKAQGDTSPLVFKVIVKFLFLTIGALLEF